MKIYTADKETGTFIEECTSVEEAIEKIAEYEVADDRNGEWVPDFYDVVDEDHCSLLD